MNDGFNAKASLSDEWETPQWLFDALDAEFGFTLDGAATEQNKKCKYQASTGWENERVFCNPPYSEIRPFVERAFTAQICVLLLPVRTDSDWFRILLERGVEMRWFRKRVAFLQEGKPVGSPRFPNVVAIVREAGR
jgi:phage N-6-adenine-methyltransferase